MRYSKLIEQGFCLQENKSHNEGPKRMAQTDEMFPVSNYPKRTKLVSLQPTEIMKLFVLESEHINYHDICYQC